MNDARVFGFVHADVYDRRLIVNLWPKSKEQIELNYSWARTKSLHQIAYWKLYKKNAETRQRKSRTLKKTNLEKNNMQLQVWINERELRASQQQKMNSKTAHQANKKLE